jgi:biopolymer transport protein ExbD
MNFKSSRTHHDPEINLIAFIDVLLVIFIFLMLSTTYARFSHLGIELPSAHPDARSPTLSITLSVHPDGRYAINGTPTTAKTTPALSRALSDAIKGDLSLSLIISADAHAQHQAVISALEAAAESGLSHISFETRRPSSP